MKFFSSNLPRPWDVSLVESVPKALSLGDTSPVVGLKSPSPSPPQLVLFTFLLLSLSTSSSSSTVHWRARLRTNASQRGKSDSEKHTKKKKLYIEVITESTDINQIALEERWQKL